MSATRMEEAGFVFERHLYNAKQVRALAKQPGFDKDELRKVLAGLANIMLAANPPAGQPNPRFRSPAGATIKFEAAVVQFG